MYIKITEALVGLAESHNLQGEKAKEVLEYLDISNRLGKHFICVEKPALCKRISRLGLKTDSIVRLQSRYSFDMQVAQLFQWHAEIVDTERSTKDELNKIIYISLNDIPHFEVYAETHVIGENLKDVRFFKYILQYFKKKHGYEQVNSALYPLLGGGSTTAEVLENEQTLKKSFSLCISDSDYAFPNAPLGGTAKRIRKIYEKGACYCSCYYHLRLVGEVENLVPLSLYKCYSQEESAYMVARVNRIENTVTHFPEILNYFDFKEGISLHSFEKAGNPECFYKWMCIECPDIRAQVAADRTRIAGDSETLGKEEKKEREKKCKYLEGLGSRILDNVLERVMEDVFICEMGKGASPSQEREYEEIGRLLFDWCCAGPVIRL